MIEELSLNMEENRVIEFFRNFCNEQFQYFSLQVINLPLYSAHTMRTLEGIVSGGQSLRYKPKFSAQYKQEGITLTSGDAIASGTGTIWGV